MAAPMEQLDWIKLKQIKDVDPINFVNSLFGEDVQTLENAKKLHKHYESVQRDIQEQVG